MSKTLIAVIVLVVLAGGGYFLLKSHKSEAPAAVVTNEVAKQPEEKKVAFSEFIKGGGTYKCEVKQAMSDFENSGTVYTSGGNMRVDFTSVAEGRTVESSFLSKDGYIYNWSSIAPKMGVKMKIVASADGSNAVTQGTYTWDASQVGDYNCVAWTADSSKFELPANVTFKLVGAQ